MGDYLLLKKAMGYPEAIKLLRTQAKMSQGDLARKLGLTNQSISGWERGTARPSTRNVFEMARIFGVQADAIMSNQDPTEIEEANKPEPRLVYAAVEEAILQIEASLVCGINEAMAAEVALIVELAVTNLRTPPGMMPEAAIRRIIRWEIPAILREKRLP